MELFSFKIPSLKAHYPVLGLTLTENTLRGALVSMQGSEPYIKQLFTAERVEKTNENKENAGNEELKGIKKKSPNVIFATALDTSKTLVRPLKIALTKITAINASLPFQAEPLLPYAIEEAIIDKIILDQTDGATNLTLVATQKESVADHLAKWHALDIEPELVTASAAALATYSHFISPATPLHFVIYIDEKETICLLVNKGLLIAAQTFSEGVFQLEEAYKSDLLNRKELTEETSGEHSSFGELNFSLVTPLLFPSLSEAISRWEKQVLRLLFAMGKQGRSEIVSEALFLGKGALLPHLADKLLSQLDIAETPFHPIENITIEEQKLFALPIGIALSELTGKNQLNFRQEAFTYPYKWHRLQKPLATFISLAAVLAIMLFLTCKAYLSERDTELRREYLSLLSATRRSYGEVENELAKKYRRGGFINENVAPPDINSLTPEQIALRVDWINKELKQFPDLFPLLPAVPKVADFLAWIATHPNVVTAPKENGQIEAIQLENISYTLVKRPEQNRQGEHYQVKVELEFTSPTSMQAREFHDALIAPNDFVDSRSEVKWNVNQGHYRTSFFLKDKTVYPIAGPK